jgi:hypothetical protein
MVRQTRPTRLHVVDETGAARTLAAGPETFTVFGRGECPLFLGLGPAPAVAADLAAGRRAYYVECPDFAAAMPPQWGQTIPANWERLEPHALTPERIARCVCYLYRQNPRLFPSFWGPVWARVQLARLPRPEHAATLPTVLVARTPTGLMEPEIARALRVAGKTPIDIPADDAASAIGQSLGAGKPELFLGVNGAGLDDDGLVFSLLDAAGVPTAIWFVDNPFHVLGRFRGPFWKKARLFVVDDAFVAPLQALGARHVRHLPLAAASHFFGAAPHPELSDRMVFVGRSAFLGRDAFFAGCRLPEALLETARALLDRGERPDYFWWAARLGVDVFWPGKAARSAGYGAETASQALRAGVVAALAASGALTVFGDPGWRELLPEGVDLRGPVDYYGALPGIYAGAGVVAGTTSLLLPRGLTQRHFDVWAAGGCLVTDATPGLDLFPAGLTAPITGATPRDIAALANKLLTDAPLRSDYIAAWKEVVATAHRYEHRLATLLDQSLTG